MKKFKWKLCPKNDGQSVTPDGESKKTKKPNPLIFSLFAEGASYSPSGDNFHFNFLILRFYFLIYNGNWFMLGKNWYCRDKNSLTSKNGDGKRGRCFTFLLFFWYNCSMRRARITYEGALHHGMNRGINGDEIFSESKSKAMFLDLLEGAAKTLKIRILAYCIMNNHYHLILENSNGRMSDFFRQLNGNYGMNYRKLYGEHGYVFQGRFKSTLIQEEGYLRVSIRYALLNPVRAGLVARFDQYIWSSANEYFSGDSSGIVDSRYVEELFSSKEDFLGFMALNPTEELMPRQTQYGEILGDKEFEKTAVEKFDRREKRLSVGYKRASDQDPIFNPVAKVIWEFERKIGQPIIDIEVSTHEGKRLRGELLVRLKDIAGLKYREIIEIPPFDNLKFPSMGKLYRDAKSRIQKQKAEQTEKVKK